MSIGEQAVLTREGLQALIDALRRRGRRVIGPKLEDQAIVYDEIAALDDLPRGWSDEQDGGHYRARAPRRRGAVRLCRRARNPGRSFLHPPVLRLWSARREGDEDARRRASRMQSENLAFIGVRSCELHAIAIQDRVLLGGDLCRSALSRAREGLFVVAVNCGVAGGTCFCVSMNTGPKQPSASISR